MSMSYNEHFRREVVLRYEARDSKVNDLATEYGISPSTIYRWVQKKSDEKTDTRARYVQNKLEERIEELISEREIFKKAMILVIKDITD